MAGEILALLAQVSPKSLPAQLLLDRPELLSATMPTAAEVEEALAGLRDAQLLEVAGTALAVPAEVAAKLREELGDPHAEAATLAALNLLAASFPAEPDDFRSWAECERLLAPLLALTERGEALGLYPVALGLLLNAAAEYLDGRGDFPAAEELARRALAAANMATEGVLLAAAHHTLGRVLADLGRLGEADEALSEALSSHLALLGAESPEARADLVALSEVTGELGDLAKARAHSEAALGDDPPDRTGILARRRLGWVLMEGGELEHAEDVYRSALDSTRELLGSDHPDFAMAQADLGTLLLEQGKWEAAREQLDRAFELAEGTLGADHPLLGVVRSNRSGALQALGLHEEARAELELALANGKRNLAAGHRGLWIRHRKLTRILRLLADTEEARAHAEEAARISEAALGADDVEFARDLLVLAGLQADALESEEACASYERALSVLEESGSDDSAELAGARLALGRILAELGRLPEARASFERALDSYARMDSAEEMSVRVELAGLLPRFGKQLAQTLETLGEGVAAERARELHRSAQAVALERLLEQADFKLALTIAESARAPSPDLAATALRRAEKLAGAGVNAERKRAEVHAVELAWRSLGLHHYEARQEDRAREAYEAALRLAADAGAEGELLHDLADVASAAGNLPAAFDLYARAAERKRVANDPRELAFTLLIWGRALEQGGEYERAEAVHRESLELLRSLPEPDPRAEGIILHDLADVHRARGSLEEAVDLYREAAERKREADIPGQLATTLFAWGRALRESGNFEGALGVLEEGLGLQRSLPKPDLFREAFVLREIAAVHRACGQPGTAVDFCRQAVELSAGADEPRELAMHLLWLGRALEDNDDYEEAEEVYRRRLALLRGLEVREPRAEAITLHDLADVRNARGDAEEAIALYRESIELSQEAEQVEGATSTLQALARALQAEEDLAGAEAAYSERLRLLSSLPEPDPGAEGTTLHDLGDLRKVEGEIGEAIELYRRAVEKKRQADDPSGLATTLIVLGVTLLEAAETDISASFASEVGPERALPLLEEADRLLSEVKDPPLSEMAGVKTLIAITLESLDLGERASAAKASAREVLTTILAGGGVGEESFETLRGFCLLCIEIDALDLCRQALDRLAALAAADPSPPHIALMLSTLLRTLAYGRERRQDHVTAEGFHRERLQLLRSLPEPDRRQEGGALRDLGNIKVARGESAEAVEFYRLAAVRLGEAGDLLAQATTLSALAARLLDAEGPEAAIEAANEAVAHFRQVNDPAAAEQFATTLALLATLKQDREEALVLIEEGEALLPHGATESGASGTAADLLAKARAKQSLPNRG